MEKLKNKLTNLENISVCGCNPFLTMGFSFLDAVKRRTLPAWIREGLEKMDREKQKKLERERMEKERAEMAKDDGTEHEADKEGDGPRVPRKSKFVSNTFLALTAEESLEISLHCCVRGDVYNPTAAMIVLIES